MSAELYDGVNIILIDFKFNEFVVGQYFVFLRFFLPFPIVENASNVFQYFLKFQLIWTSLQVEFLKD